MTTTTTREQADQHADALAFELAQATNLSVGRVHLGGGADGIEAHVPSPSDTDSSNQPPAAPHVLITVATDPGVPTDEHGNFPWGVHAAAYDRAGDPDPADAGPLVHIDAPDAARFGTQAVTARLKAALLEWRAGQRIEGAHTLAASLASRTGLTVEAEFTLAGTGAVMARIPGRDGGRHLQITVPGDAYVPTDGRGGFPDGVVVCEFDDDGPYPDGDTPPVLDLPADECGDPTEVEEDLVECLRDWFSHQQRLADADAKRAGDVSEQSSSVAVGRELALAWEDTPYGDVDVYVTDIDGERLRTLALVKDRADLPAVLAIAADTARLLYPASLY